MIIDLNKNYQDRQRQMLQCIFREICQKYNVPMDVPKGFAFVGDITDTSCAFNYYKIDENGNYNLLNDDLKCPLLDIGIELEFEKSGKLTGKYNFTVRCGPFVGSKKERLEDLIQEKEVKEMKIDRLLIDGAVEGEQTRGFLH